MPLLTDVTFDKCLTLFLSLFQSVPSNTPQTRSLSPGNRSLCSRIKLPHTFSLHSYTRPTVCQFCKKLLRGIFKQGVQCRDCHYNAHKKCVEKIPKDCPGENPQDYNEGSTCSERDSFFKDEFDDSDFDENPFNNNQQCPTVKYNGSSNHVLPELDLLHIGAGHSRQSSSSSSPSANIPLMRIVQSVKHTKRRAGHAMKEGWLVHFTSKDKNVKRHYWRLDSKAITLYISDQGSKYYKEIPLNEILAVETAKTLKGDVLHCFEIRTANVDYFVGQDPLYALKDGEPMLSLPPPDSGVGAYLAKSWETAIRQALMPVTASSKFVKSESSLTMKFNLFF